MTSKVIDMIILNLEIPLDAIKGVKQQFAELSSDMIQS